MSHEGLRWLGCIVLMVPFSSCSQSPQAEDYPFPGGSIVLTEGSHPHGYRHSECFLCHIPRNLHAVDRLGHPSFSLARPLVDQSGISSCSGCHGTNGVGP